VAGGNGALSWLLATSLIVSAAISLAWAFRRLREDDRLSVQFNAEQEQHSRDDNR
jgi:hypothetical protein